ncbi:MAG: primosomal protein N' [Clostridiaceae bacterium]|nr:primosomal protein N' [Clostridiaceae bacterium]
MFVSVIIANSTREYDIFYDYIVPGNLEALVQPGVRVLVPFGTGRRLREAFVMEVKQESEYKELKQISQVIDEIPVLTPDLITLSRYMKKRYVCTYDLAIRCMLPSGLALLYSDEAVVNAGTFENLTPEEKKIFDIIADHGGRLKIDKLREIIQMPVEKLLNGLENKGAVKIVNSFQFKANAKTVKVAYPAVESDVFQELVRDNSIKSQNYIRIMEILYDEGAVAVNELNMLGFSNTVLKNMENKGYISFIEEPVERNPVGELDVVVTEPKTPTSEQKKALDVIREKIESGAFHEILLHGITGSGKTEVYMQVIADILKKGKNAIMLVPEIGLTPQMVSQLMGRFKDNIAVIHSRLSMGERYDQWKKIRNGEVRVVVGARSAIFAPLPDIGIIIIDEEHESSYKSDRTPKYDARTIAAARCKIHNAVLLYGSATPSVENYWRARTGKITLVEMKERTNKNPLPQIIPVDMREEMDRGARNELSSVLIRELRKNKEAGEQAILFINRRGYSNFILCRKCGFIAMCPYCSVSLTWHRPENRLVCHYCSYSSVLPGNCPICKSDKLQPFGLGTQKVEEVVSSTEPGFSVIRMDFDTTAGKRGHQAVLETFRKQKIDVMVGTQMVAKGHDFPDVTLVGILSADSLLGSGDFRAGERTFQLITQAAGRAGRAGKHGRVVLQAYNLEDYSIQAAIRQDYHEFFSHEIKLRYELKLPPFYQFGLILVTGKDKEKVQKLAERIHIDITRKPELNHGVLISAPAPSPVSKIKGSYRWRILLKHQSIKRLGSILEWVNDSYNKKGYKDCTVSVDINPANMV